jgi:dimethylhistidine N-methyltransferase
VALIELGSGAATKVRPLLAALTDPAAYVPVDVAREQLLDVATERAREFPTVAILPVWADYSQGVTLPELDEHARRVVFFPGSTIGNLHPDEAEALLLMMRELVGTNGGLLLGVDRRKGTEILHPAYNDAAGVTAAFNLNSLRHLNREFGGTFDLAAFRHRAIFNTVASRIEMHLDAVSATTAQVLGEVFHVAQGESIRTEVSYKYDRTMLDQLAAHGGWQVRQLFTDPRDWFWVVWLEPVQD